MVSNCGELAVDWNRIEGNWKQLRGKIKEKWGDLTDDDLDKIAGRRDQLGGLISNDEWSDQRSGPRAKRGGGLTSRK
jgi:uncharacterized protein YjbJ (UPF0337 family)